MALQLQTLLEKIGLIYCVTAFVKDEGNNLATMATTLESIVDCEPLKFFWVHEGFWFGQGESTLQCKQFKGKLGLHIV